MFNVVIPTYFIIVCVFVSLNCHLLLVLYIPKTYNNNNIVIYTKYDLVQHEENPNNIYINS